jgi:EmrB/QacA subfamily drug resistance transporter
MNNDDAIVQPVAGRAHMSARHRWLALVMLCLGMLMIVFDSTVVNVALPSIKNDLNFSETSLTWVVNAYALTFGGFLLLAGRMGDLYGHRRMFLFGISLFTVASVACGVAGTTYVLVAARAVQGIAGAVVGAVALSLIMDLFVEPAERAKAMGVYGFVCAGGGSLGAMLGGVLTGGLGWHWIFLVNVPIGLVVAALSLKLLPGANAKPVQRHLDMTGSILVTASLMLAVYAIVNGNDAGWTSLRTLSQLCGALLLLVVFCIVEMKVRAPLMDFRIFRRPNVAVANVIAMLWAAGVAAWFFLSALYLQSVLGYSPIQVGLAFLPANLIMAVFSLGLSGRLVTRLGGRWSLLAGQLLALSGLLFFSRIPVNGQFVADVLPGMLLLGTGAGIAMNPMLLIAMNDVAQDELGMASGMVNTSLTMGGALGLAILSSIAAFHMQTGNATSLQSPAALSGGYQSAFLIAAMFEVLGLALNALFIRSGAATAPEVEVA